MKSCVISPSVVDHITELQPHNGTMNGQSPTFMSMPRKFKAGINHGNSLAVTLWSIKLSHI